MADAELLKTLIAKWTSERDHFLEEAKRLSVASEGFHSSEVLLLEARAEAIGKCICAVETLDKS